MSTEHKELQKVPELWFDDADVIFQAGNKLFRVHRSILSARSPVFRDMFSVPPPSAEADAPSQLTLEGCTLVQLPDSENDVLRFFLGIFDASFFESPPSEAPMDVIVSILRLAHKYDVKFLTHRAVSHLNRILPTDMATAFFYGSKASKHAALDDNEKLTFFEVMEVAFNAGILWILPCAFFWSVELELCKVLKSDQWKNLSPHLQEWYLINREHYIQAEERAGNWLHELSRQDGCSSPARCSEIAKWYRVKGQETIDERKVLYIPPGSALQHKLESTFCSRCASDAVKLSEKAVKKLWDDRPIHLGLPGWETLLKEKADFETS